jgi:hypothetical protein
VSECRQNAPSDRSPSRPGRPSPPWQRTATGSRAAAGAWHSTPRAPRRPVRRSTASARRREPSTALHTRHSCSTARRALAGASSVRLTSCRESRAGLHMSERPLRCRIGGLRAATSPRVTGVREWPPLLWPAPSSSSPDWEVGSSRDTPEPAGSVPAGFLFNGALSTYEQLGFTRDRMIGKHRWVVTRTVEPIT